MGKRLYVGNLPYTISDGELQQLFEQHGSVTSAQVVMDRDTGRSKGFGFVEMGTDAEAQAAIAALHGADMVRTHEPKALRDALIVWSQITSTDAAMAGV